MALGKTDRVVPLISAEHKKSIPFKIYGQLKNAMRRNRKTAAAWKKFKENHKV